ncbi:MAG: pyrimidine-nucleoside phosphorylase, partial [Clostridia bacterium]|nr:pyrimidine-nucleoside phosphorylase [Clostridia bacterium]
MNITELISKKRRGFCLSDDEINWIINSYTEGNIEDYHMSALAM